MKTIYFSTTLILLYFLIACVSESSREKKKLKHSKLQATMFAMQKGWTT